MNKRIRLSVRLISSFLLIAGFAMWLSSCSKSSNNPTTPPGGDNPTGGGSGTASVKGVVKDASVTGSPVIAGATVKVVGDTASAATVTTDANGLFTLSVAGNVNKTISVTKDGYSLNQVVVKLDSNTTKSITVSLLPSGSTKSVSVSSGGTVADTKSNATLKLPANFVTASGNVSVTVTGLDPTTGQIRALPGGLDAIDANNNKKYLQPVSFAEYTVKDADGKILQFNTSASSGANIELPIPASLRGKVGYKTGDPIECYLYDPTDGKWKTPVPGVIGPSSVDGSPAIKATIFHLSWYGGAPALNQRSCISGYVKNSDGAPAAGADVEAFPGGTGTTDATGFYDVDAAPSSNVRIVATVVSGSTIRSADGVVYTGASSDSCSRAPDLTLGLPQQGSFKVDATLYKIGSSGAFFDYAAATIKFTTTNGASTGWDSAAVKIGYGNQFTTLPSQGSGSYMLYTGLPGAGNFSLAPGQQYEITIDFDKNGTIDANGTVRMVGSTRVTNPTAGATVGKTFTATWKDTASSVSGYSANYWLTVSGVNASRYFLTTTTSKVIGDGSIDSTFYGYAMKNDPLPAGDYTMGLWSFNGPAGFFSQATPLPNINGQNVEGYFYSYYLGESVSFKSSGSAAPGGNSYAQKEQHWKVPLALKNFYKAIPADVKKRNRISFPKN
jgi:hypothetical protein